MDYIVSKYSAPGPENKIEANQKFSQNTEMVPNRYFPWQKWKNVTKNHPNHLLQNVLLVALQPKRIARPPKSRAPLVEVYVMTMLFAEVTSSKARAPLARPAPTRGVGKFIINYECHNLLLDFKDVVCCFGTPTCSAASAELTKGVEDFAACAVAVS